MEHHISRWNYLKRAFQAIDQSWVVAILCRVLGLVGLELGLVDSIVGGTFPLIKLVTK